MKAAGERISTIVRTTGVSLPTVYRVLQRVKDGDIIVAVEEGEGLGLVANKILSKYKVTSSTKSIL